MKVTKVSNPEVFKPVTLQIVLENIEEYKLMHVLMQYNISVPQCLVDLSAIEDDERDILAEMMGNICMQLAEK